MMNIKFSHVTLGIFTKVLETDNKHGVLRTSITYVRISNKELMRIFERESTYPTGRWRKIHNAELHF